MDDKILFYISVGASIVSVLSMAFGIFITLAKLRPETRNIDANTQSSLAGAAESVAEGAKVSNDLLLQRIEEMEEREKKRDVRERQMLFEFEKVKSALADWQDWARRLVHQVKSLGHEPVPFKQIESSNYLSK